MRIDENWAVAPERIRAFFLEQADVQEDRDCFRFRTCTISLVALTGQAMGRWKIPRTQVIFEGDDEDVQTIHHRFFLRFLSAGG